MFFYIKWKKFDVVRKGKYDIIWLIVGFMINDWSVKEFSILGGYFVGLELYNNYGKILFYVFFNYVRNLS